MPKVVDAAVQRRAIRNAARRVFAQRGVAATGLSHVAEAAGMGRSSLYHYYSDKAALLRDLTRDLLDEEEAMFRAAARADGSPLERIERLAGELAHWFDAWASVGRLLSDLRFLDRRRFRRFFRNIRNALATLIVQGQESGEIDPHLDPEIAAATVIGAIDGLLLQEFAEPGCFRDREALAGNVQAILRKGLVA